MLAVWAIPLVARAQDPLIRREHNWTITIGGSEYGAVQWRVEFTEARSTTVYFGRRQWTTRRFRADHIAVVILLAMGAVGGVLLWKGMAERRGA